MRSTLHLRERGISLVETALIVTLIVSMGAVVVPGLSREIHDPDLDRCMQDSREIAAALYEFTSDTGFAPTGFRGAPSYSWLRTSGVAPEFVQFPEGAPGQLSWFLERDLMGGGGRWRGPYLKEIESDPWGHHYVLLIRGFDRPTDDRTDDSGNVWVLSAGPDGLLETGPFDTAPAGDDMGILLR